MKVICINSENKPNKIPFEEWIEEGKIYTVIDVSKMGLQDGKLGFKLEEIELGVKSFPYEYYDSDRFKPILDPHLVLETVKNMFDSLTELEESKNFSEEDVDFDKL